jgi:dolichol-phosphate mannosyltransferase
MIQKPELSVVVPFYNEEANAAPLMREIRAYLPEAELIAVDDGSTDATWEALLSVPGIVALRAAQNRGQSAAVYAGLCAAQGQCIGVLDGDGQNDPADLPRMLVLLREGGFDVVHGRRTKRMDSLRKRIASRMANRIRRMFFADGVHDAGCGIKVFRREAVQYLVPFNGMHRYMAAIFAKAGLRLAEMPVNHRPRTSGRSKYTNWERALRGLYDLFGVAWLLRRKVHYSAIERADTAGHCP